MYLRPNELVPLYATEWICLAAIGFSVSCLSRLVDVGITLLKGSRQNFTMSKGVFAMVASGAMVIGVQAWVESFGRNFIGLRWWHFSILAVVLFVGMCSLLGRFAETLIRLRSIAFPISLAGGLCVLPCAWIHVPEHTTAPLRAEKPQIGVVHPNIVLISIDALSARHLIPYGSLRQTSPNIADLADHSLVFDRFYSVGNFTTIGVSTILTGVLPWTHRALQLLGRPSRNSILDSFPAKLHVAGYTTAYFASNPWAGASREGFSTYFDYKYSGIEWETAPCLDRLSERFPYLCSAAANPFVNFTFKILIGGAAAIGALDPYAYADPASLAKAAERWISQPHNSPVFMWIHFLPPHDPYAAPEPWLGRFDVSGDARTRGTSHPQYLFKFSLDSDKRNATLQARYDESVSYVDSYVGELISIVRSALGENTAIILTADHGESFDHGYGGHGGVMLYEDLIHIPLIIEIPGSIGEYRHELSDQADLAPTIAEIAGTPLSPDWDGMPLIQSRLKNNERTIFSMNFEQNNSRQRLSTGSVVALTGDWKLMQFFGEPKYPGMPHLKPQLFNIAIDPDEQRNVARDNPEIVTALSKQLDTKLEQFGGAIGE